MKTSKITVTVSRTQQVAQYEPLTISIVQEIEVKGDEDVSELRVKAARQISRDVALAMEKEVKRHSREAE